MRHVSLFLMQSEKDADRIIQIGAPPERTKAIGNIKFDQPLPVLEGETSLRRSFGLHEGERLILAGSTHPGEEELLVSAYGRIVNTHSSAVLMLAPSAH